MDISDLSWRVITLLWKDECAKHGHDCHDSVTRMVTLSQLAKGLFKSNDWCCKASGGLTSELCTIAFLENNIPKVGRGLHSASTRSFDQQMWANAVHISGALFGWPAVARPSRNTVITGRLWERICIPRFLHALLLSLCTRWTSVSFFFCNIGCYGCGKSFFPRDMDVEEV